MRASIRWAVAILISIVAACQASPAASPPPPSSGPGPTASGQAATPEPEGVDQVLLALDFFPGGQHSGFFVALDKGYYAEERLAVQISRGYGSLDTVKRLASGQATFGFADTGSLLVGRSNEDLKVKAVAMIYQKEPHAIFYNADRGITAPKDLEGKTFADTAFSSIPQYLPAFCEANGVDCSKIKIVNVDSAAIAPTLLSGQADAVGFFTFTGINLATQAEDAGMHIGVFPLADYGVSFYGHSIQADEKLIASNPDLVARFVRASIRGYQDAMQNPEEATTIYGKYFRDPPPEIVVQEVELARTYVLGDPADPDGIGAIDPARMQATIDIVSTALGFDAQTVEDVSTTTFLP